MRIDPTQEIEFTTKRLILKVLNTTFTPQVIEYYKKNLDFFQRSLPLIDNLFLTEKYQTDMFWAEFELMCEDRGIRFYLFKKFDLLYKEIIGDISVANIMRGSLHTGTIGCKLSHEETGKGYMTEAMKNVLEYCFSQLNLHRIEAVVLPDNKSSIKLIENLGFEYESTAKKFQLIFGKWQDHQRYVIFNDDWKSF